MNRITIRNRQRTRVVSRPYLRRITATVLAEWLEISGSELGIHLIGAREMAGLNEKYLQHHGSTDVITFNHAEALADLPPEPARAGRPAKTLAAPLPLFGEIFISIDDAVAQARQFRTTWQAELVRYVIHGILHLRGYDDLTSAARRTMKKEENRLLSRARRGFPLSKLKAPPTLRL